MSGRRAANSGPRMACTWVIRDPDAADMSFRGCLEVQELSAAAFLNGDALRRTERQRRGLGDGERREVRREMPNHHFSTSLVADAQLSSVLVNLMC